MRVLVDARPAVEPRPTGIGTYTRAILRYLPLADLESRYVAWYLDAWGSGARSPRFVGWAPNLEERPSRIPARLFGPVSVRTGVPKVEWLAGRADLVLATNFLPPATSSRGTLMVVHDLAFAVFPGSAPHQHARWRRRFDEELARAAAVILPSEAARADLLRWGPIDPDRAIVIHHGIDRDAFSSVPPEEIERIREQHRIGGPYVLSLGGLEPRKNLETLVRAFGLIEDPDVRLVIAGGAVRWAPDHAERVARLIDRLPSSARSRVIRTGYVDPADRRALLAGADILAFPSRYEGFGFPILEGFASGTPVLTSNVSSMPEVAGDAAVLVDPDDAAAIAGGLVELLQDNNVRSTLRAAGDARLASFTWERCASRTADALHDVFRRLGEQLDAS